MALFRGKVFRKAKESVRFHQQILGRIASEIDAVLKNKTGQVYIGPFDVRLSRTKNQSETFTVVQPDICIICDESKLDERGCVGAPDTIIEILCKGNIDRDIKKKFDLYEEFGVKEYWIVAPGEKTISAYLLNESGKYKLSGVYDQEGIIPIHSIKDFNLNWEDIFE